MSPRSRSDGQVLASARAMDQARAAGLPDDLLAILLAARSAHQGRGPWPPHTDLARAVAHPAAEVVDQVLVRAVRRRLRSS